MKKVVLILAMFAFVIGSVYASYSVTDVANSVTTEDVVQTASDDIGTPQDNPKKAKRSCCDKKAKKTDCSKAEKVACSKAKKTDSSKAKKSCCDKKKTK